MSSPQLTQTPWMPGYTKDTQGRYTENWRKQKKFRDQYQRRTGDSGLLRCRFPLLSWQWRARSGLYGSVAPRAAREVWGNEARELCFQNRVVLTWTQMQRVRNRDTHIWRTVEPLVKNSRVAANWKLERIQRNLASDFMLHRARGQVVYCLTGKTGAITS